MTKVHYITLTVSELKLTDFRKVGADIKSEHQSLGLLRKRGKRTVHKSTGTLLDVPRYSDLLEDQNNEDENERGRLLITTREGWRTDMARWIGAARDAEHEDESDEDAELPELLGNGRATAWKPVTLAKLFGGQNKRPSRLLPAEIDAESELMQALAEIDEDERPDDGAVEIHSDDEYIG